MRHDLGLFVLTALLTAFIVDGLAQERGSMPICEELDRGLVAQPTEDGCVYVGWRLLNNDPEGVAFNVYRSIGTAAAQKLNREPIQQSTNFIDSTVTPGTQATYLVRTVTNGREGSPSEEASIGPRDKVSPYLCIKLDGDHTFQKVGIADLNGDGRYDFVIKQPNANIDPYVEYWKPSPDTYKIEAYLHNGRLLWRHDLGWAIERGIWYSPYVVYDLNGDGKAEIVFSYVSLIGTHANFTREFRILEWDGSQFVEFKRASGTQRGNYNQRSSYFPDVSFDVNVDETIICYPRPLLVMVFDAYSS